MNTIDSARVHRFGNTVALSFDNEGGLTSTIYLDPDIAQNLALLLGDYADDIGDVDFQYSTKGTMLVSKGADGATIGRE